MDSSRQLRDLHVLIGDDDLAVREAVVEIIADRGFTVYTASSGTAALRTLLSLPIDFTILDVEMPEMTGIEVLEAYVNGPWIAGAAGPVARSGPRTMPTIFMSGNPAREIRHACESLGEWFLDKPFAADDVRTAVDRILARHSF